MKYFNNCQTLNELKNEFRNLSKKLHPDTSGYNSQSDFIRMYAEFKELSKVLKFKTGHKDDQNFNADEFYNRLKKFDGLRDIKISFVGSWIWLEDEVNGAMYEQKETIKTIELEGYNPARWARNKLSWHFAPITDKKAGYRGKKSLSEIKATYKTNEFKTKKASL